MNPTHYALLHAMAVLWCRGRIGKILPLSSQSTTRTCSSSKEERNISPLTYYPYLPVTQILSSFAVRYGRSLSRWDSWRLVPSTLPLRLVHDEQRVR